MFKKEGRSESGTSLVAINCELLGDVHFSDELLINGIVKGNIYAQSGSKAVVRISEKGRVIGEIRVPRVIINGKVCGDIRSDKHIELAAKAEIKGDIYYHLIEMVQGSIVDGHLVHLLDGKQDDKQDGKQDGKQVVADSNSETAAEKLSEEKSGEEAVAPVAEVKTRRV